MNLKPKVPTKAVCVEHLELRNEILTLLNLQKQVLILRLLGYLVISHLHLLLFYFGCKIVDSQFMIVLLEALVESHNKKEKKTEKRLLEIFVCVKNVPFG